MTPKSLRSLALVLLQRLLFSLLVLVALIYLTHFGLDMARGLPFWQAAGDAFSKTGAYIVDLVRGDLGMTQAGSIGQLPLPVSEIVPERFVRSLGLLGVALTFAAVAGVSLGIYASSNRRKHRRAVAVMLSIVGVSVPSFFAALLLQMAVIQVTRITGTSLLPVGGFGWDARILLPALVLAARPLAQITRVTSVALGDTLEQDYIRTAYSKGLTERLVFSRHVLRNIAVPVLTTIGLSLSFALSSLPVVEFFFGWPGLGFTLLRSISLQDDNLTVALVLCMGSLFILLNLVLDLSYRLIDPRLSGTPEHVQQTERGGLWAGIRSLGRGIGAWIRHNPLQRWLKRRGRTGEASPFHALLPDQENEDGEALPDRRQGERRAWLQATLGNLLFVLGGILVAGLIGIVLFGPQITPHSPYTTQGLKVFDGKIMVPPFEPGDVHPWGTDVLGRDIMSLILAGAQQTLILTTLVVLARLVVGFLLGAIAGWFPDSAFDRGVMGLTEIFNAFPSLLLAMILILGLGIRRGMSSFVIALCFLGWPEIMRFVRGQVMSIRPRLFIESAVALGQTNGRIIFKHVLPNLVPGLISLISLEMGAVLMLLGELGFIGIFIGGGAFAELDVASRPYHYSDVPEWGALLSNVRAYARAYPWTAFYPALAFFIAILGFNLFGEGLRRLVEIVGVSITRVFNRYSLGLALVAVVGFVAWRGSTGSLAVYERQAEGFSGEQALSYLEDLTAPEMEGRALGTEGVDRAAEYIAQQFADLGLQAAGENFTFFQTRKREYDHLSKVPELVVQDGGAELVYRQDYVEYPWDRYIRGQAQAEVKFLGFSNLLQTGGWRQQFPALLQEDFSQDILLVSSQNYLPYFRDVPRAGLLIVTDDPVLLSRRYTLSSLYPDYALSFTGRTLAPDAPILWISPEVANRILASTGQTLEDLHHQTEALVQDELLIVPSGVTVQMDIKAEPRDHMPARHVIGHLPGTSSSQFGGMDNQMVVVMAQYDTPPVGPEGEVPPGANDNASGVAVMLETIRTLQEEGFQPYRTFLFVAYSGEGFEGGEPANIEVERFLQTKYGFANTFDVVAVVNLRGVGAGEGEGLQLAASGSLRLVNLFDSAARRMGVPTRRTGDMDISIVFEERSFNEGGQEAPQIGVSWQGWSDIPEVLDTSEIVSANKLEQSGRTLSLALMIIGRERDY